MTKVTALNTLNGVVSVVNESVLRHAVFSKNYVQVDAGTKSFQPDLWVPRTADEYRDSLKHKGKAVEPEAPVDKDVK